MSLEMSPGDLPGPEFFDVYYNDSQAHAQYDQTASTHAGAVTLLGQLKKQLLAAYSQCAPLKRQLRRIEMSMDSLGRDVQRL